MLQGGFDHEQLFAHTPKACFRRDLAFDSAKTRFKAILKELFLGLNSLVDIRPGRFTTKTSFGL